MGSLACTDGVDVFPYGGDIRLEMMSAFKVGRHIVGDTYSSYVLGPNLKSVSVTSTLCPPGRTTSFKYFSVF